MRALPASLPSVHPGAGGDVGLLGGLHHEPRRGGALPHRARDQGHRAHGGASDSDDPRGERHHGRDDGGRRRNATRPRPRPQTVKELQRGGLRVRVRDMQKGLHAGHANQRPYLPMPELWRSRCGRGHSDIGEALRQDECPRAGLTWPPAPALSLGFALDDRHRLFRLRGPGRVGGRSHDRLV
jgi:hypothetical protein